MRILIAAVVLALVPGLSYAQDQTKLGASRGLHVAVIDGGSREWQGRLLEVGKDAIALEVGQDVRRFSMTDVKRVDAHGDKVWDGALKGAAFGGVMALVAGLGRFAAQSALSYALVGVAVDAMVSCTHTVYRAPAPAVGVKVSF